MALNKLTLKQVRSLGDGFHSDGGNLYLRVQGNARSWIFRYRQGSKQTDLGLGSALDVPLSRAREKAADLRARVADGQVPKLAKRKEQQRRKAEIAATKCVRIPDIIEKAMHHTAHLKRVKNPLRWASMRVAVYRNYGKQYLDKIPMADMTKLDVYAALSPIWDAHSATAKLLLGTLRQCFTYAAIYGYVSPPYPTDWKGSLDGLLPALSLNKKPHAAVPWQDLPELFPRLVERGLMVTNIRDGLLATILCATRHGEIGRMDIEDIDWSKRVLVIRNRKDGKKVPFLVPFPTQVDRWLPKSGSGLAFPYRVGTPISSHTAAAFLQRVCPGYTVHGFRATFSTWCADHGKDPILREMCLCHQVDGAVAAAYQRSDLLEPRRALLQEWADYVTSRCGA